LFDGRCTGRIRLPGLPRRGDSPSIVLPNAIPLALDAIPLPLRFRAPLGKTPALHRTDIARNGRTILIRLAAQMVAE